MKRWLAGSVCLLSLPLFVHAGSIGLSTQRLARLAAQGVPLGSNVVTVTHAGGGFTQLTFTVSDNAGWLSFSPTNASCDQYIGAPVTLRYHTEALAAGVYTGRVSFYSAAAIPPVAVVTSVVTITNSAAVIGYDPHVLEVTLAYGATNTFSRQFEVWNDGTPAVRTNMPFLLTESVAWLALPEISGNSTGQHCRFDLIFTNLGALGIGTHTAEVQIADTGYHAVNSPQFMTVRYTVTGGDPLLGVDPDALIVGNYQGRDAPDQTFTVHNWGGETMEYTIQSAASWITCAPNHGTVDLMNPDVITVKFDTHTFAPGAYNGAIVVRAPALPGTSAVISVSLAVTSHPYVISASGLACTTVSVGSTSVATQRFEVWNVGASTLEYAVSTDLPWLSVWPNSGTTSSARVEHELRIAATGLVEGVYTGAVSISGSWGTPAINEPYELAATVCVASALAVAPAGLTNNIPYGGGISNMAFQIANPASGSAVAYTLSPSVDWISLSASNGIIMGDTNLITVSFSILRAAGAPGGIYQGLIRLEGFHQSLDIPVEVNCYTPFFTAAAKSQRILFSANLDGDYDIWSIRPDGSDLRQLFNKSGDQTQPRLNPDGNAVLFLHHSGPITTWVLRDLASGDEEEVLLSDPVWDRSGDGWYNAQYNGRRTRIERVLLDETRTPLFQWKDQLLLCGLNRAGEICYLRRPADEFGATPSAFDPRTGKARNLMPPDGRNRQFGTVSPDGRILCHTRSKAFSSAAEVCLLPSGGGAERVISRFSEPLYYSPAFSPDGRQLAIARRQGSLTQLVTNNLNGGEGVLLSLNPQRIGAGLSWGWMMDINPLIALSTNCFTYPDIVADTNATLASFEIWNSGNSVLTYSLSNTVSWLTPVGRAGTSTGEHDTVSLRIMPYGLDDGAYTGAVWITANSTNAPQAVTVVITVQPPPSQLATLNRCTVGVRTNSGAVVDWITVWNSGGRTMTFTAGVNQAWMMMVDNSGSSTGNVNNLRLQLDSTGLPPGSYTGLVTVVAGAMVNVVTVRYEVVTSDALTPRVGVTPATLTNFTPRYLDAPAQALAGSNAGGGTLNYYLADDMTWISILPGTAADRMKSNTRQTNTFQVAYNTRSLGQGSYTGRILVLGNADTATVAVSLVVGPPNNYRLTVVTNGAGTVTLGPSQPTAGYTHGSTVLVSAAAATGWEFDRWDGPVAAPGSPVTVLIIRSNITLTAMINQRTAAFGYIRHAGTGAGLSNALITFSGVSTNADKWGNYRLYTEPGMAYGRASREGFYSLNIFTNLPSNTGTRIDFDLQPNLIRNVKAWQLTDRNVVRVTYDLYGLPSDKFSVDFDVSADGGYSWNIPTTHHIGQIGNGMRPGTNLTFAWDYGADYPGQSCTTMLVRLTAWGCAVTSKAYKIDGSFVDNARFRTYADKNNNDRYDIGEEIAGAEFYFNGRTTNEFVGLTGSDGTIKVNQPIRKQMGFFARKAIAQRPAERPGHEAVSNIMRTVWLDSDVGAREDANTNWNGVWATRTFNETTWGQAQRNEIIDVPMNHSILEWHLVIDYPAKPAVSNLIQKLHDGLEEASRFLYLATYGQQKFGMFHIVTTNASARRNADVELHGPDYSPCCANPGGIYREPDIINDYDINMNQIPDVTQNQYWVSFDWGKTLVHEFGHYGLSFYDEYQTARLPGPAWRGWRATNNYQRYPKELGFMEHETQSDQLSSGNDYPPDYLSQYVQYVGAMFSGGPGITNGDTVTDQIRGCGKPCWEDWQESLEKDVAGIPLRYISPPPGFYSEGKPSTEDRWPTMDNPVKPPYNICQIKHEQGPWTQILDRANAPATVGENPVMIQVRRDGQPVAGARIIVKGGRDGLAAVGRTRADGCLPLASIAVPCLVEAYWQGAKGSCAVKDARGGEVFTIELLSGSAAPAGQRARLPLATNQLGVVVAGSWIAGDSFTMHLYTSCELTTNPAVTAYQYYWKEVRTNPASVFKLGPTEYQVSLPLTNGMSGYVEISCLATNGQTFNSLDQIDVFSLATNDYPQGFIVTPGGRLPGLGVSGLLYRANGPVILPPGHMGGTNQLGPAMFFTLSGDYPLDSTNIVKLDFLYTDADFQGVDLASVGLYRWEAGPITREWQAQPYDMDPDKRSVAAVLTNSGVYVVLCNQSADITPPAQIADLAAMTGADPWTIRLDWTAVGNDGTNGTAVVYDLRFSTNAALSGAAWTSAYRQTVGLAPQPAGAAETVVVRLPAPDQDYWFALRAGDAAGNWGEFSSGTVARAEAVDGEGRGIPDRIINSFNLDREIPMGLDDDFDGDGLTTWDEYDHHTDANLWDTDGDGMGDGYEVEYNLDPLNISDRDLDPDGDGLTNREESDRLTNPFSDDTDGDGMTDDWELEQGLDPLTDGRTDGADSDPDADTYVNIDEYTADTEPTNSASYIRFDSAWLTATNLSLEFWSSARRLYELQFATDLPADAWQNLVNEFYGTGGQTIVEDTNSNARVIYRLKVRKP